MGGSLRKGTMASASTCLAESCPSSSFPDARQFSSFPYVCGACQVSAPVLELRAGKCKYCAFVHGLFKRNAWVFRSPLFHSATTPTGFYSQSYRTSLSGTGILSWGVWRGPGTPYSSGGNPHSGGIPLDFCLSLVDVGAVQSWFHLLPVLM